MPRIIKELTVQAPVATVWQLVSDMERFSACIPGCKEVRRLSDTEFDWVLEARVLRTTRKVTARTRATEMHPPHRAVFSGEGRIFEQSNHYRLNLQGATDLQELPGGMTRVRFEAQVSASGLGGPLVEKIAAGQMDDLFGDFENNVKQALAGSGAEPSAVAVEAAETAPRDAGASRRKVFVSGAIVVVLVIALLVWAAR